MGKDKDSDWHLIRNNNGEWISDRNVVFLSDTDIRLGQITAKRNNLSLTVQTGLDGSKWCYKHEVDAINAATPKTEAVPRNKR